MPELPYEQFETAVNAVNDILHEQDILEVDCHNDVTKDEYLGHANMVIESLEENGFNDPGNIRVALREAFRDISCTDISVDERVVDQILNVTKDL